ncbi:hypothetical protein ACIF8T_36325 [Streptomyces sp. NPDC085946]|uniref:aromatic-ring hydroxylase C-terminal domain-containing protein n=1 Tax=Streptomyces sp. NPDC085946 TaxID=3365744 RepID=UPI0037CEB715
MMCWSSRASSSSEVIAWARRSSSASGGDCSSQAEGEVHDRPCGPGRLAVVHTTVEQGADERVGEAQGVHRHPAGVQSVPGRTPNRTGRQLPLADPSAHPLTGTRAPDLAFASAGTAAEPGASSLFALLRADRYVLLDLTGSANGPLRALARPGLAVHARSLAARPDGWSEVRAVLLRPDGHLVWAGTAPDDADLAAAADQALTALRRVTSP